MHWPFPAPPLRGALLNIVARLTAIAPLRALVLQKLLRDTRIRELPKSW